MISMRTFLLLVLFKILMVEAAPTCELPCGDSQCVSASDRCDNIRDCENGSDEENCDYLHNCPFGMFMCKSGECMPAIAKCNGTRECMDESDERGCRAISLSQSVLPTAADYEDEDKHTSLPPSRPIQERPKLKKHECPQRNASLYFTNQDLVIYRVALNGSSLKTSELLLTSSTGTIQSLSVDFGRNEVLYVGNQKPSEVRAVDPEDSYDRVLVKQKDHRFSCIAKDWLTDNIYFAEDGVGIGICLENPRTLREEVQVQCMVLVKSSPDERHRYRDLVVHPRRGLMMWIQDEPLGVLKIAGMDGSKVRTLSGFEHVHAISFDYDQEKLYIAEGDELEVMDLRTLERTEMKSIEPIAMAVYNCDLYYVDRNTNMLKKFVDVGDDLVVLGLSGLHFTLTMAGENSIPNLETISNPCGETNCAEFCTLTESPIEPTARCQCTDCHKEEPEAESSVFGWMLGVLLVVCLLFLATISIAIYFRLCPVLCEQFDRWMTKDIGANESNISVGYNNPAFKS